MIQSGTSEGQGVYVGGGIVLTAAHVVDDLAAYPTCSFSNGHRLRGHRLGVDSRGWDLAAILIDPPTDIQRSRLSNQWPNGKVRSRRSDGLALGSLNGHFRFGALSLRGDSGGPIWSENGIVSIISRSDFQTETLGPPPAAVYSFVCHVSQTWGISGSSCGVSAPAPYIDSVPRRPPGDPQQREDDRYNPRPYLDPSGASRPLTAGDNVPTLAAENVDEMVEQATQRVLARLAKDERFRGPAGAMGPRGLPGAAGKSGPAGPAGQDGKGVDPAALASIDAKLSAIQAQQEELKKRFAEASFPVQVVTPAGDTEEGRVHIEGGMLRLDLSNLK